MEKVAVYHCNVLESVPANAVMLSSEKDKISTCVRIIGVRGAFKLFFGLKSNFTHKKCSVVIVTCCEDNYSLLCSYC